MLGSDGDELVWRNVKIMQKQGRTEQGLMMDAGAAVSVPARTYLEVEWTVDLILFCAIDGSEMLRHDDPDQEKRLGGQNGCRSKKELLMLTSEHTAEDCMILLYFSKRSMFAKQCHASTAGSRRLSPHAPALNSATPSCANVRTQSRPKSARSRASRSRPAIPQQ